jgi:hypothetical protein
VISVICVYNDRSHLEKRLLDTLRSQHGEHEWILVDNRANRFDGAAKALNWGASQARGDWLVFAHQDVALLSPDWLARAASLLERFRPGGWVGVAGRTDANEFRGFLIDREMLLGTPFEGLVEVQTLDECLLIHRRQDGHTYFDEGLTGWHAYGVEACCRAICHGQRNYVLPLLIHHDSKSVNLAGLDDAHAYVFRKYGDRMPRVHTSCGVVREPTKGGRRGFRKVARVVSRKLRDRWAQLSGFRTAYTNHDGEVAERLTDSAPVVEVLHRRANWESVEVKGFVPQPGREKTIVHRFTGLDRDDRHSDCVFIAPDLAEDLPDEPTALDGLRDGQLIISVRSNFARCKPKLYGALRRLSSDRVVARNWNETEPPTLFFKCLPP